MNTPKDIGNNFLIVTMIVGLGLTYLTDNPIWLFGCIGVSLALMAVYFFFAHESEEDVNISDDVDEEQLPYSYHTPMPRKVKKKEKHTNKRE